MRKNNQVVFKKKNIILNGILIIYMVTVFTHCFFPRSSLNKALSTKIIFAQFYSFPILFGCIVGVVSLLALAVVYYKSKAPYYKNTAFLMWLAMLVLSVILIVFGADVLKIKTQFSEDKSFKIVEWNTENNINKKNIYTIFGEFDADIAVFPELGGYGKGAASSIRLEDLFESANLDLSKYEVFESLPTEGNIAPVTIIVKKEFYSYENNTKTPMTTFGTVYLETNDTKVPDIIGLHTTPPLPGLMKYWNRDLKLIASDIIRNHSNAIIIGDFNATLRHGAMNDITTHEDALNYLSWFKRGTWSAELPSYFCTPIDHILLPKDQYTIKKVDIVNLGGSDHKAIFAEVTKEK